MLAGPKQAGFHCELKPNAEPLSFGLLYLYTKRIIVTNYLQ